MENKNHIKDIIKEEFNNFLKVYKEKQKIFEDAFGVEYNINTFQPEAKFGNPLFNIINCNCLDESLTLSYPIEKVKEIICRTFNIPRGLFFISTFLGVQYCSFVFPINDDELIKKLDKSMEVFGYKRNIKEIKPIQFEPNSTFLKYEKIFQDDDKHEDVLQNNNTLIHITEKKYVRRIKKNGFIPKSENEKFNYNPRVHFLLYNKVDIPHIISIAKQLCYAKYGFIDLSRYVVIYVDVNKIQNGVEFHKDIDFNTDIAIWAYHNVTPNAIKEIKDIISL